ncbi:MAG: LysR family transcriptional regulator [Mesorhizobium sp.]|nr:MAG: LysR family transcriptional regulator [Mesorhizobium sp.]
MTRAALRLRHSTSAMSRTLSRLREALGDPVLVPAQTRRQPAGPRSGKTTRPSVALRNWAHKCRNAI